MIVNEIMKFETYNDFFDRREMIKRCFDKLDMQHRQIYRYYLYANRQMSTTKLDLIWEYLAEPSDSEDFPSLEKLSQYYVNS